ncbi:MAG: transglycosylase domain-containing protein [Gemmatimonadota bacterium]
MATALFALGVIVPALFALEAIVVARLPDVRFRAPTRIYARPVVLSLGMRPSRALVEDHLRRLGYVRATGRSVGLGEYDLGVRGWVIGRRPFRHHDRLVLGGTTVVRFNRAGRIARLEDERGRPFSRVALEPEIIGSLYDGSREDRVPVRLADVPEHLVEAVLTIEDQRFFAHGGLDLRRIAAAMLANLRAGRIVQGGSTLTQQLAKNLYLSPRRTLVRKVREAAIALALERRHEKREILEAYLNEVYLGQAGAIAVHGVGAAARHYFAKDVGELDLSESALLAGLIRGPSLYSPFRHPAAAKSRRDLVLRLMRERGVIAEVAFRKAQEAPLEVRKRREAPRSARYFVDFVAERLRADDGSRRLGRGEAPEAGRALEGGTGVEGGNKLEGGRALEGGPGLESGSGLGGGARLEGGGLAVFTTLDMRLQRAAGEAVREGLARLESQLPALARRGPEDAPLQAALIALDPRGGQILAMVGGREYGTSQFNRAVRARRQPGSAFKPIVALAAVSRPAGGGRPFTLASVLEDEPLTVETPAGPWRPVNYDRRFRGAVTLREALERSLNVPFARLGIEVGPPRIVEAARELGIQSPLEPYPSLALGAFEVTPLELTRAYAVLAAGGFRTRLRATLAVLDPEGNVLALGRDGRELAAGREGNAPASGREGSASPVGREGNALAPGRAGNGRGQRAGRALEADGLGERVYDPAEAYLVTSALRGAVERGTGRGLRALGFYGDVAAKSGTTNGFRDAWFMAYTPALAVGVWVGFDDGRSLGLPGARVALPIFARFMIQAVGPTGDEGPYASPGFSYPAGLELVEVDPETGLRAGPGCRGRMEVFLAGTAPEASCWPVWLAARRGGAGGLRRLERYLRGPESQRRRELGRLFGALREQVLRSLDREARVLSEPRPY